MKKFRILLIGPKYVDTIINIEKLRINTNNKILRTEKRLGGIRNISKDICNSIIPHYQYIGSREAIILEETKIGRRTSLTKIIGGEQFNNKSYKIRFDWVHIAYIDDIAINCLRNVLPKNVPFSVDFCTQNSRKRYKEFLWNCELIFDSLENVKLYNTSSTKKPIVLHSPSECRVKQNGKIKIRVKWEKEKFTKVNGAGDIYAANFISLYLLGGIELAVKNTHVKTINSLRIMNRCEKI